MGFPFHLSIVIGMETVLGQKWGMGAVRLRPFKLLAIAVLGNWDKTFAEAGRHYSSSQCVRRRTDESRDR